MSKLDRVRDYTYTVDQVSGDDYSVEEVVDIFNRVNSRGTPLKKADLALAHVCSLWPEARAELRSFAAKMAERGFDVDLNFLVRCLAGVATGSVLLEGSFLKTQAPTFQGAWRKMQPAFEHLVGVLRQEALISGLDDLPTNYVLIPAAIYLARQGGQFPSDVVRRRFVRWIFLAGLWARYSGSTDTKLQQDVALVTGRDRSDARAGVEHPAGAGPLLIGVDDAGATVGLGADYRSLKKPDRDGFELHLQQVIGRDHATTLGTMARVVDTNSAALATSIHLVCRPRPENAPVGDWADVLHELPRRVADWMDRLQDEGIRGADLVFACIGPALEIFSRHRAVETVEGRAVGLAEYLEKVWEVVGRTALESVLGAAEAKARNGLAGALEEDARLTALFLWTLQATAGDATGETAAQDTDSTAGDATDDDHAEAAEGAAAGKAAGFSLVFDVVRRFAQPLGLRGNVARRFGHRPCDPEVRLFPAELDGRLGVGMAHRLVLVLVHLDEVHEQIELPALCRPGLGTHEPVDPGERCRVVVRVGDRLDVGHVTSRHELSHPPAFAWPLKQERRGPEWGGSARSAACSRPAARGEPAGDGAPDQGRRRRHCCESAVDFGDS